MRQRTCIVGQLSIEFLMYAAVSMFALTAALSSYLRYSGSASDARDAAYITAFAALAQSGSAAGSFGFVTYIPKSICTARLSSGTLYFGAGSVYVGEQTTIPLAGMCAHAPGFERFSTSSGPDGKYSVYLAIG